MCGKATRELLPTTGFTYYILILSILTTAGKSLTSGSETIYRKEVLTRIEQQNKTDFSMTGLASTRSPASSIIDGVNSSKKTVILVRHACSEANEYMYCEGNRWGDPTFTDDEAYLDSILSPKGLSQAELLAKKWAEGHVIKEWMESLDVDKERKDQLLDDVLLVTSPMTRTMQTMSLGVLPFFAGRDLRIVALPHATERVYTASDTGRPVSELEKEFPHVDFDSEFDDDLHKKSWWYSTHDDEKYGPYEEWRPSDEQQFYAAPGEPKNVFNERMNKLCEWISMREEKVIVLVTHWGVIRHLTGDEDVENCGVKFLSFDETELKRSSSL